MKNLILKPKSIYGFNQIESILNLKVKLKTGESYSLLHRNFSVDN